MAKKAERKSADRADRDSKGKAPVGLGGTPQDKAAVKAAKAAVKAAEVSKAGKPEKAGKADKAAKAEKALKAERERLAEQAKAARKADKKAAKAREAAAEREAAEAAEAAKAAKKRAKKAAKQAAERAEAERAAADALGLPTGGLETGGLETGGLEVVGLESVELETLELETLVEERAEAADAVEPVAEPAAEQPRLRVVAERPAGVPDRPRIDVPSVRAALRPTGGPVDLSTIDPRATPAFTGDKADAVADIAAMGPRLAELQEKLYAQAVAGGARRRVLLVVQGMDTSGKGGTVKHVIGQFNPSGCHIHAFKAPTEEELGHPFLWRIRNHLPGPGLIGVFDRSHYEDVLIARVRELVPRQVWARRYGAINRFEQGLAKDEVTVVKVFLHISPEEQKERLLARLDNPDKHWKFNPADIDERAVWPQYQAAYEAALERCDLDAAPWYVVPSDRKWYRNWAISRLLLEHLTEVDPQYPPGTFDVEAERKRLLDT